MVHIFVDDSSTIAWSQDIGAAQCLPRRKFSDQILWTVWDSYLWQYCQCQTRSPHVGPSRNNVLFFFFFFYLLKKQVCQPVSVDGTPKDAVCRFYFSIELNQLQLTAELSDQETKGSMHWHWQWNIERYHPKCGRPAKDVCPALCFSPYDTIGDKITAPTFSCSLQTMLEC